MANEWLSIFRTYSDEDLAAEVTFLKAEVHNLYITQNMGTKSYQRDLTGARSRLFNAIRVQQERAGNPLYRPSVADFQAGAGGTSDVNWGSLGTRNWGI